MYKNHRKYAWERVGIGKGEVRYGYCANFWFRKNQTYQSAEGIKELTDWSTLPKGTKVILKKREDKMKGVI